MMWPAWLMWSLQCRRINSIVRLLMSRKRCPSYCSIKHGTFSLLAVCFESWKRSKWSPCEWCMTNNPTSYGRYCAGWMQQEENSTVFIWRGILYTSHSSMASRSTHWLSFLFASCVWLPLLPGGFRKKPPFAIYIWIVFTVLCFLLLLALWKRTVMQRFPSKPTISTVRVQDRMLVRGKRSISRVMRSFPNDVRHTIDIEG